MLTSVIELTFMGLSALAGIGFGWWLHGGRQKQMTAYDGTAASLDFAGETLARLQDLATTVASNVGQHTTRVEEINQQLTTPDQNGPGVVVQAVAKLLAANKHMQQQLAVAEGRLQEQAQEMRTYAVEARTDALTGLPNRRAFDAEIDRLITGPRSDGMTLSIVMLDVDHFKKFNDTYGHQAGDEVLRNVADVLRCNVPELTMVARFGGEEFVVIALEPTLPVAQSRVEAIRTAIQQSHVLFNGTELRVTVSLGLAQWIPGDTASQLVERADAALYAAKEAGRNRAHWHDGQTSHPIQGNVDLSRARSEATRQPDTALSPVASRLGFETKEEKKAENRPVATSDMPNRMAFCTHLRHRLAEWRRSGRSPSVVLVRVDEFDRLTAVHGVRAGDIVLEATAKFLNAAVRDMDIVAAMGDRLFGILLPGADLSHAINVSERLRQAIANCSLPSDRGRLNFTVSIGGAEANQRDDTAQLLRRAEEALLASTKSGGNCCYFHNGQWSETAAAARERLQTT